MTATWLRAAATAFADVVLARHPTGPARAERLAGALPRRIDTSGLRQALATSPSVQLVMVRSLSLRRVGHLPGSLVVGPDDVQLPVRVLDRDRPVVVYGVDARCLACTQFAEALGAAGFRTVAWYVDGVEGWAAAGHPTEGRA